MPTPTEAQGMARGLAMTCGVFMTLGGLVMCFTKLFPVGIPLAIIGFFVLLWGVTGLRRPEQPAR